LCQFRIYLFLSVFQPDFVLKNSTYEFVLKIAILRSKVTNYGLDHSTSDLYAPYVKLSSNFKAAIKAKIAHKLS